MGQGFFEALLRCPIGILQPEFLSSLLAHDIARRNGVGLCGDATRQGISGPTVRQWCIKPLTVLTVGGRFVFHFRASRRTATVGSRPTQQLGSSSVRKSRTPPRPVSAADAPGDVC